MENNDEIRKAGDYEITHSIHIGDRELVMGENSKAEDGQFYFIGDCTRNDLFERFENAVNEIRFYNSRSLSFANDGLRILGAAGVGQQTGTYDAAGRQRDGVKGASLFETEV